MLSWRRRARPWLPACPRSIWAFQSAGRRERVGSCKTSPWPHLSPQKSTLVRSFAGICRLIFPMQLPRNCRECKQPSLYGPGHQSCLNARSHCVGHPAGKETQPPGTGKELPASAEVTQPSEKEGSAPARTGLASVGQSRAAATLFEIAAKPCAPADSATEQEQYSSSTQPAPGDSALIVTCGLQAC